MSMYVWLASKRSEYDIPDQPQGHGVTFRFTLDYSGASAPWNAPWTFRTIARSTATPTVADATAENTGEVDLCDLDGDGEKEILLGNGDVFDSEVPGANRLLTRDPSSGRYVDAAFAFGLEFSSTRDLTADVECGDSDGDGITDMVVVGNRGGRNWLYVRRP